VIVAILVVRLEAVFLTILFSILVMLLLVESKAGFGMMIEFAVGSMAVRIFSALAVLSAKALAELVIIVFFVALC